MTLVRPATLDDAGDLARIHVDTWRTTYTGLIPQVVLAAMTLDRAVERWQAVLPLHTPHHCLLAEDPAGDATGFVRCGPSRDEEASGTTGEIQALYVQSTSWSTGTGRALLKAAEKELLADGFTEATSWVLAGNDRARRFYQRCGWRTDGGTKQEQREGVALDEVRYRHTL
ncbi:GNAT family N-acetyltransferase [Paenibacillus sp. TRM 82003]|uniref:GNAT family N-acetyltransferase n=1 Tax=Kineococcus sp. TRM81007 TaxID=2925831 RepID=UPI001F55FF9C|nr:GNAT family N-acetyltransferase [Kineococcus sp. TRM81007]MCI2238346.1 GNAT family N-acetyltransferase [Kineococcus sp. TRM81007]MCI3922142.1 GNAT family N-acetyltransferase [Paenibacillus sp. TRM 82003]